MNRSAYILLGSNISPKENIRLAIQNLQKHFTVTQISNVYETAPIVKTNVENYLNACVEINTDLDPLSIKMDHLRPIEAGMGRVRTSDKFKPRVIDLDLILIDGLTFEDEQSELILPDPEILKYAHIAVPLADIIPEYIYPATNTRIAEIAENLRQDNIVSQISIDK